MAKCMELGVGVGLGWGLVQRELCKTIYSDISSETILLIIYILCCKHRSSLPSDEVLGQGWICRNYFTLLTETKGRKDGRIRGRKKAEREGGKTRVSCPPCTHR